MVCSSSNYNDQTGICSNWDTNEEHPDFDHSSNLQYACNGLSTDCYDPVLNLFFCAEDWSGNNQCLENGTYDFSDTAVGGVNTGHGTPSTSIIVSTPGTDPLQQDDADYLRGTGLAPSAQVIVAKFGAFYAGGEEKDEGMSELQFEELMALVQGEEARFANNSWNLKHFFGF